MRRLRFFPALIAAAFFLVACDDQKPTSPDPDPTTGPTVNGSVAARRPYRAFLDSMGNTSGGIVVHGSADRRALFVGIDTVPQNGSVDKLFVLQSEFALNAPDLSEFVGRISYRNRFVRVTTATGTVLTLSISSDRPLPGEVSPKQVLALKGFGLARRTGSYTLAGGQMSTSDINRVFTLSCNQPALFRFTLDLEPLAMRAGQAHRTVPSTVVTTTTRIFRRSRVPQAAVPAITRAVIASWAEPNAPVSETAWVRLTNDLKPASWS
jgi:hypothetical protein